MNATAAMLRVLLFTMLAMLAVYFGVGYLLLASEWQEETTRTLDATPERVAAVVRDLHTWERWAGVDCNLGPQTAKTVEGAPATVGHRLVWTGPKGKATLTLIAVADDRVEYRFHYEWEGQTAPPARDSGVIEWSAEGGGCRVRWRDRGEWQSLAGRWVGWFGALQQRMKQVQVASLEGLQNELRSKPAATK